MIMEIPASLMPEVDRQELNGFYAWAKREDGMDATNEEDYVFRYASGPNQEDVVWGPGGVIVWSDEQRQWAWADDLEDPDPYYTDEYRARFP